MLVLFLMEMSNKFHLTCQLLYIGSGCTGHCVEKDFAMHVLGWDPEQNPRQGFRYSGFLEGRLSAERE